MHAVLCSMVINPGMRLTSHQYTLELSFIKILISHMIKVKTCSNEPNNVDPISCNNVQMVFYAVSFA